MQLISLGLIPIGGSVPPDMTFATFFFTAVAILLNYYFVTKKDVLIIVSNSGINAVPVEMAIEGKKREAKIIAITSIEHSKNMKSRHPSGKKLYELADVVIDNYGVLGDAILDIEGVK